MKDYIIRATASYGQIRAFAVTSRGMVETARMSHNTSPVVTAALGRTLTAAAMMGVMMKGEKDVLTLHIEGTGPMRGLNVTADSHGHVKGYPFESQVDLPANALGKLDVGGAVGFGNLVVIKDLGLKEPYVGQVVLQTSEIAEDLTYYFATSEQVPSAVGLGVLMNKNNTVAQAGGYIIQLMPDTSEEIIGILEERLAQIEPVTTLLTQGYTPEQMLEKILDGLEVVFSKETIPASFSCNCSKERMERALISLGSKEMESILADGEPVEIHCHFCNTNYIFDIDELSQIKSKLKS